MPPAPNSCRIRYFAGSATSAPWREREHGRPPRGCQGTGASALILEALAAAPPRPPAIASSRHAEAPAPCHPRGGLPCSRPPQVTAVAATAAYRPPPALAARRM